MTDNVESPAEIVADPSPIPPSDTTPSGSLGSRLREAREAAGHSVADVVQVIRFSAHQIEALERDDYARLPGATSVRGLVRSYSKFLKIDPAPLLAMLDPVVPVPEADVRPPTNMGEAEDQMPLTERIPSGLLIGTGVILVLAISVFWFLDRERERAPVAQVLAPAPAPAPVPALPTGPAQEGAAVMASAVPAEQTAPAPTSAPMAVAGLRIEFDELSWVEVRDASQKIVLVGEFPAGTRQNVEGSAPFQLWIGKASGVRVFMGERSIDLKPHTREEVARLTLE